MYNDVHNVLFRIRTENCTLLKSYLCGQCLFPGDELRLRKNDKSSGEYVDSLLKYQHSLREKVAEEMLIMAKSLKEQTQLAGSIIKSDIQVIIMITFDSGVITKLQSFRYGIPIIRPDLDCRYAE